MADLYRKSALERISSPEQLDKTLKITSPMSWLALIGVTIIIVATIIWSIVGTIPVTLSTNGIVVSPTSTNAVYTEESGTVSAVMVAPGTELHFETPIMTVTTERGTTYTLTSDQVGSVSSVNYSVGDKVDQNSEVIRVSPTITGNQAVVAYVKVSDVKKIKRGMSAYITLSAADSKSYGHMEARIINIDSQACSTTGMAYVLGKDNNLSGTFNADGAIVAVTCELYPADDSVSGYYWSNEKGKNLTVDNGSICSVKIITERVRPITKFIYKLKEIWGE